MKHDRLHALVTSGLLESAGYCVPCLLPQTWHGRFLNLECRAYLGLTADYK